MSKQTNPAPRTISPAALVGRLTDAEAPTAREDRSVPVSEVSRAWAEQMNANALASGQPVSDVDALATFVESYAVKQCAAQMVALARVLSAEARRLTSEDVRVIANESGSSARFFVPGLTTRGAEDERPTGERMSASASVTVTPGSAIGKALRALGVAPRAIKRPKK